MELFSGITGYIVFFLINAGIYAVLTLGLNVQWGYTGLFNVGVAGFYMIGAYASAIVTTGPSTAHIGGLSWPPGRRGRGRPGQRRDRSGDRLAHAPLAG